MRIWSLHPVYLDTKGLVALWREALLARHVLEGKTKGYTHHPQLDRFNACSQPVDMIHLYLRYVFEEANRRGYKFDPRKFNHAIAVDTKIPVTTGQVEYERQHLVQKLILRDPDKLKEWQHLRIIDVHPIFEVVPGGIADWERS